MIELFSQEGTSGVYDLTSLHKAGKIYVMDNHLAAAWCWGQELDLKKSYNIFHIDKHYDLLKSSEEYIASLDFELDAMTINEYTNLRDSKGIPVFRFDNYLTIFNLKYPAVLNKKKFATHNDGTVPEEWEKCIYRPAIYDLPDGNVASWVQESNEEWIINIDIDYFFHKNLNGDYFQFLTDEYIVNMSRDLRSVWPKIKVLTIALSPNFCGGMLNAQRISDLIVSELS